jgi:hypothetical protein
VCEQVGGGFFGFATVAANSTEIPFPSGYSNPD